MGQERLKALLKGTTKKTLIGSPNLLEEPPNTIDLIEQVLDAKRGHDKFFRPSMLFGCDRANYFHYQRAPWSPPDMNNRLMKILDNGTAVHSVIQGYLRDHPGLWFAPESKVEVEVSGALIRGSCDGIVIRREDSYRWGIEIKTINHNDFMKLTKPKPDHVEQASLYAVLHRVHWITVVYWDKDKNVMREYPVPFDPGRWTRVKKRVRMLKQYVDERTIPKYDRSTCNTTFCKFVDHCRKKGAPV